MKEKRRGGEGREERGGEGGEGREGRGGEMREEERMKGRRERECSQSLISICSMKVQGVFTSLM